MPKWENDVECGQRIDAPAYVQGELSPEAGARFESHLKECQKCQSEVQEVGEILALLKGQRDFAGKFDLLPRILNRIAPHVARRGPWRTIRRLSGLAALVLFGVGLVWGMGHFWKQERRVEITAEPKLAIGRAVDWLIRAQEPSGGWSAARWGGQGQYDIGLTGLASIVLLNRGGREPPESPALNNALAFLLHEQSNDGRFGPEFGGTLYNHGIATVALLESFGLRPQEALRDSLDRALSYICRTQAPSGGWGYQGSATDSPNTAVTCWPLQALVLARTLGWRDLDRGIAGGFGHLVRVSDQHGRLGYRRAEEFLNGPEALSSMGAFCVLLARDSGLFPPESQGRLLDELIRLNGKTRSAPDLYRDFFLSSALQALPAERAGQWPRQAQMGLAATQIRSGTDRGSWEPNDRWAGAGGRLYSTALAALILEVDQRGKRLAALTGRNG